MEPASVADLCTVITTTSATPSNPSTDLIETTLRSLAANAPELCACRNIVVCDDHIVKEKAKFRCGEVTAVGVAAYEEYVRAVQRLAAEGASSEWQRAEVLTLEGRHGFGFAVRAALPLVETPFVCVVQHDRAFVRPFLFVRRLLSAMQEDGRLKMVALPTSKNDPSTYVDVATTKLRSYKVQYPPFDSLIVSPPECPEARLIPLIMWHDSTHIASTSYYRNFVFGERNLVSRGGFIEDKLGQQQGFDLREFGWSSHAEYGTWLLDDRAPPPTRMVGHYDGKQFCTADMAAAREAASRAQKARQEPPETQIAATDGEEGDFEPPPVWSDDVPE